MYLVVAFWIGDMGVEGSAPEFQAAAQQAALHPPLVHPHCVWCIVSDTLAAACMGEGK